MILLRTRSLTYTPDGNAPSFHMLWKLCLLLDIYSNVVAGLFPHLEHIIFLDGPLSRPVFDVFLSGLLDVFTASIGNCFASSPRRKTCCLWTFSDCWIHVTAFSSVRSAPSICSRFDNLSSWIPATKISLISSSCRAPRLQYLAKAYSIRHPCNVHC